MAFKDATETLQPWLDLPIAGKLYRIPAASIATGVRCQSIVDLVMSAKLGTDLPSSSLAALQLDDDAELEFNRLMLSDAVYDEMVADGVGWEHLSLAAKCAFTWTTRGRDAAEEFWNAGGQLGNARRPAPRGSRRPADRKAPAKKTTTRRPKPRAAAVEINPPT